MKGIDVSHYQGKIDFNRVRSAGYGFALLKATEGASIKDPTFEANYKAAKAAGLLVGAYHFATFTSIPEAVSEAKHFQSALKGKSFDIIPQLDLEQNHAGANLVGAMKAFFGQLGSAGLYSFASFYLGNLAGKHTQPLWYARYASSPIGVSRYAIWQYSSQGRVPGIGGYVDLDVSGADFNRVLVPKPVAKQVPVKAVAKPAVKPTPVIWLKDVVVASDLNVRSQRSINSGVVLVLPKGSIVAYEHASTDKNGWGHITYTNSKNKTFGGYVQVQFIKQVAAPNPVSKPAPKPAAAVYHTVASGDTVGKLAAHYSVSINQIRAWNHLDSKYTIYINKKIRVK